ncbi:MAG: outer membrane lipoprotein-sorting protein [Acidobacteria bacterium]|nr:outer membrane lipoprotein-sorting protein [Acidobacteriota bacterium]
MRFLANLLVLLAVPAAAAPGLDAVLDQMDTAARSFRNLSATVHWVDFTAIVNDTSAQSGSLLVRLAKPRAVEILIDITQPDPKKVAFQNRQARIFYPKLNTVQVYDLGKQSKLVDQFLLLGFGTPGKELAKNYTVRVIGEEVIDGQTTAKLELIPKSEQVREQFNKVELWITESGGYPLQQKAYQPSGNYRQATYSDIKLNVALPPEAFKLRLPAGVTTEHPGR